MGLTLSKNDNNKKNTNRNVTNEQIIELLLDKNLNGCLFEKYIDFLIFLLNHKPLTEKEKTFKYYLKLQSETRYISENFCMMLITQKNNEPPIKILDTSRRDLNFLYYFSTDLNKRIDISEFIDNIKEINILFINSNEISEYDVHILNKKLIELESSNISEIEKMIEIESIKNNIKNLTYLEKLDKLEKFFIKMSKSIVIPEAIEIVNSKIPSALEERNFVIAKEIKVFNH